MVVVVILVFFFQDNETIGVHEKNRKNQPEKQAHQSLMLPLSLMLLLWSSTGSAAAAAAVAAMDRVGQGRPCCWSCYSPHF